MREYKYKALMKNNTHICRNSFSMTSLKSTESYRDCWFLYEDIDTPKNFYMNEVASSYLSLIVYRIDISFGISDIISESFDLICMFKFITGKNQDHQNQSRSIQLHVVLSTSGASKVSTKYTIYLHFFAK